MWHNANKPAFWQAHGQFPQLPEFEDFYESLNAVTALQLVKIGILQDREKAGTYSGFDIPIEKTPRKIALVMGTDFREFCRTSPRCISKCRTRSLRVHRLFPIASSYSDEARRRRAMCYRNGYRHLQPP